MVTAIKGTNVAVKKLLVDFRYEVKKVLLRASPNQQAVNNVEYSDSFTHRKRLKLSATFTDDRKLLENLHEA